MRGQDVKAQNMETIRLAKKYLVKDGGVVAIDLAGAEGLFPTADYKEEFEEAQRLGIPVTIHAGEADGAESVKTALEFGAVRIGHGVRSFEDPGLLQELKRRQTCLEMCPTSNRQTKAIENMEQYPLTDYLKMGICVTINTDDMAISRTTIQKEFSYVEKMYGLTEEQKERLFLNAVQFAFTTDERKKQLINEYAVRG